MNRFTLSTIHLINPPKEPAQWIAFVIALCITIPCGIWIFRDAQKRGHFPWLWGLWGIMSEPLPLIFYYIFIIRADKKRNNRDNSKNNKV